MDWNTLCRHDFSTVVELAPGVTDQFKFDDEQAAEISAIRSSPLFASQVQNFTNKCGGTLHATEVA